MPSIVQNPEQMDNLESRGGPQGELFDHENHEGYSPCEWILFIFCILFFIILSPLLIFTQLRVIKAYERGILLRFGKLKGRGKKAVIGPGITIIVPFIDSLMRADLRLRTVNIPPQEVLTSDAVTVNVDAVVYLRITDPAASLLRVKDVERSAELLAVSTLRNVIGTQSLNELLTGRELVDKSLSSILDTATEPWGVKVSSEPEIEK
ncbi:unnamed protein product [Protopolystoma xenopodis]|uniref:Band 7 domain-containing protein n=1 Tax=Protopolystoma xenopodis TaxID=117903 RepID=A0A3S5A0K9_9PLAT|nr:unnamed protein product [Protopolystoma xenopodis]